MFYLNYKKNHARQLLCLAFAVLLTTALLALAGYKVKSQHKADFKPSPFKFNRLPAPEKESLNKLSAPTTAGSLDPTFNGDGKLTTDFSSSEVANAVALQADGKTVAAGTFYNGTNYEFAVFRYNADGSLDTSFDGDGKVTTSVGGDSNSAYAVAIQTDSKIIAGGYIAINNSVAGFALVRYNADGALDASFGAGGKVITAISYGAIYDIAIQTDGKIVAAGSSRNDTTGRDFTLARYNPDGSLDTSSGTGGIVTTDFGSNYDVATSVAVQADGKIVAVGYLAYELSGSSIAVARYNADGSLDTSFDTDGKVITQINNRYGTANAVAIQTDGKIVAAGESASCFIFDCDAPDFTVVRYNTNGSLDTSFDTDGKVITDFGGWDIAYAVAIQTDGKIVTAGRGESINQPISDFVLSRYNTDGSLDASFGVNGKVATTFGEMDAASDIAVQAGGKIVAAGYSGDGYTYDFALSRYNADGSLDARFGGDGKVITSVFVASSVAKAVAIQDNGAIILAGYSTSGTNTHFAVARYYGGSLDSSFRKITPIGNEDVANAVAIQSDGKIVVAGYTFNGSNRAFALVRYNVDGSLDTSFDGDGKVVTDLGAFDDEALAVAIQTDGKIVAVGYSSLDNVLSFPTAVVRYNSDGTLDTSFGTNGKVIIQSVQAASSIVIQPDGKIIAAGYYLEFFTGINDFALARFNTDGLLDTTFDGDGVVLTHFSDSAGTRSVTIQPDGKIIAAGFTHNQGVFNFDFALARYNGDGSLDTSFDMDGKVTTAINMSSGALAVGIQRNGKIVAAGSGNLNTPTDRDFAVVRYNPNGSLDTSFDSDGKLTTDFFGYNDDAYSLAIQRDGRIIAAGSARNGTRTDFAAARYIGDLTRVKFDYDGDGRADISVFRTTQFNGSWFVFYSASGRAEQLVPNFPADKIVPADYDGDGRTDIAQYNSTTGTWYLNLPGGNRTIRFGAAGDIPVPSDYDGDGKDDVAVYRPSTGIWWTIQSSNGAILAQQFGIAEDKPVVGDYDGDGFADLAVYRPSQGVWHILQSSDNSYRAYQFGISEDKPIVGDYDGDGKNDLAVYRPSTNVWYVLRSVNRSFFALQFGFATDIQTPADYDGDGKTDIAVFRPSNGVWYVLRSSNGRVSYTQFGLSGDVPTPSAFIPQ